MTAKRNIDHGEIKALLEKVVHNMGYLDVIAQCLFRIEKCLVTPKGYDIEDYDETFPEWKTVASVLPSSWPSEMRKKSALLFLKATDKTDAQIFEMMKSVGFVQRASKNMSCVIEMRKAWLYERYRK